MSYNRVYERLVDDDDDLIGLIAYALYKQSKRDWLISHREEYGNVPTEEQFKIFENSKTEHDLKRLRSQAEEMLLAYSDSFIEQATPEIREDAIGNKIIQDVNESLAMIKEEAFGKTIIKEARDILTHIEEQNSFWSQIKASLIGGFAYSLLLLAFALILKLFGSDLLNLLHMLGFIPK